MKEKIIYIQGMHCASCEKILGDEFKNMAGVTGVKMSQQKKTAEIFYEDAEPSFEEIRERARKLGYEAFLENDREKVDMKDRKYWLEWAKAVMIVVFLAILYKAFNFFGITDKIDFHGAEMRYGIAFIIGLAASVSSCLATVGAVVIAFGEKYATRGQGFFQNSVKPHLLFHAGRLSSFFIFGGLLGAIGGELSISGNEISLFTMFVAIVMVWLGLNILGTLPASVRIGVRMPKAFSSRWESLKKSEHKAAPLLLGALSFFLPCGFTQSMQVFALASGSFMAGAVSLLVFASGTLPVLLVIGITASWTRNRGIEFFKKAAGLLVLVFAFYTFQSGLALRGVKTDVIDTGKALIKEQPKSSDAGQTGKEQVVKMSINRNGFEPSSIKIKNDVPVKWIINGDQVTGCTNRIIIPALEISQNINYGENIILFTPKHTGELPFSCGMGMVRGKFIVE